MTKDKPVTQDISMDLVIVDSREPADTTILVKKYGNSVLNNKNIKKETEEFAYKFANCQRHKLELGDLAYRNIAIELKSWNDFFSSIKDNRFRNQLYNFTLNKKIDGYYFIHGNWKDIYRGLSKRYSGNTLKLAKKKRTNQILGAIASIEARYGLHVNIFPTKAFAIYTSCKIIEKSFDHRTVMPTTYKATADNRAIDMLIAAAAKLGPIDAKNLLEHFGTAQNVINATVKQLQEVRKIGKVKAERLIETVHFDFKAMMEFEKDLDLNFDIEENKIR